MRYRIEQFIREEELAKTLPHREVTRAEFVKAMTDDGADAREADLQATVSKVFNDGGEAWTRVGNEMIRIVEPA